MIKPRVPPLFSTRVRPAFSLLLAGLVAVAGSARAQLITTGAGSLTLSGSNTYTGGTLVTGGTLTIGGGTGTTLPGTQTIGAGTLTLNSASYSSGALNLASGTVANGAGTLRLVANTTAAVTSLPVLTVNNQLVLDNGTAAPIQFTTAFPVTLTTGGLVSTITFPGSLGPGSGTIDYGTPTAAAPAATGNATLLSNRAVSVHGSVAGTFAFGPVQFAVEYGLTGGYGSTVQVDAQKVTVRDLKRVFATVLDGLAPGSTYHYRTKATLLAPLAGTTTLVHYGADKVFTTAAAIDKGPVWITAASVSFDAVAVTRNTFGVISFPFPTTDGLPPTPYLISFGQGARGTVTANGNALTYTPSSSSVLEDVVLVRIGYSNGVTALGGNDPSTTTASFTARVKILRATLPTAVTGAATIGSNTQVQLAATFAANGPNPQAVFDYGFDTSYGMLAYPLTLNVVGAGIVNIAPSTVLTNLEPGRTYHYRARMSNGVGTTLGADATFTTPPYVDGSYIIADSAPVTFDGLARVNVPWRNEGPLTVNSIGVPGSEAIGTVTQGAHGTVTFNGSLITYTPGASFAGDDSFTYTVMDPRFVFVITRQLPAHVPFAVRVAVHSLASSTALKGATVPGTTFTYQTFDAPEPGVFAGSLRIGSRNVPALFAANGSVKLKVGDAALGAVGSVLNDLGAPSGQAAVAKLKPGGGTVTGKTDTVLLGGLDGTPRIAAREGQAMANAPGLSIKSIGAFDGNGSIIFFRATLKGAGVEGKSDAALCAALPNGSVRLILREGTGISTIATLVGLPGTLAEGRWRAGSDRLGVRLGYSDGSQVISIVRVPVSAPEEWTVVHHLPAGSWERLATDGVAGLLDGTSDCGLGIPGFGGSGGAAYRLISRIGHGGVTSANNVALLSGYNAVLARKSDPAPLAPGSPAGNVVFHTFGDPIVGAAGRIAFAGTLAGPGITSANRAGIWFVTAGSTPRLVARARDAAPGGGLFAEFTSLALPDGPASGPIFTGTLVVDRASNITGNNNFGLWGMDRTGALRLLLRTGQSLALGGPAKIVASFTALTPPAGSIGAAHGYDNAGSVSALVTFDDRSVAVVKLFVP